MFGIDFGNRGDRLRFADEGGQAVAKEVEVNKPLPEGVKKWLETTFVYKEYGAGAELVIGTNNGGEDAFVDFESHLDAEAFLELLDWLKSAGEGDEQPQKREVIRCEHCRVSAVWSVPIGNRYALLCQECVDRLVGVVVRNLLGEIPASQLFASMAAGLEAAADPLTVAQREYWKKIARQRTVETVMLEGVIGHIAEMAVKSPNDMTFATTLMGIHRLAVQAASELAQMRTGSKP